MDWAATALAARRAQAVYIMDAAKAKAAFTALGDSFVAQYQDADSQAVLSTDAAGAWHLSLSGTRFSDGQIGDLIDDLQTDALDLGGGAKVTRGPYESAKQIFAWALKIVPADAVVSVCGHSLGGWRLAYTPCFLAPERIGALHAFEPPKGANAAYYAKYAKELAGLVIVGNGRDIWFGYPRLGAWIHRPGQMVWLTSTGFQLIDTAAWPGGLSLPDHSIDLVVDRLEKIAANSGIRPAA
jgi:hypothetical protein